MPPIAGTKVAQEGDGRDHAAHAACTDQVGDAPVVEELGQPLAFRRGGRGAHAPGQVAGRRPGSEIKFRYPCERGQYVAHEDASESIGIVRSEEHTSELQSLMRISYAVFCLKKKTTTERR